MPAVFCSQANSSVWGLLPAAFRCAARPSGGAWNVLQQAAAGDVDRALIGVVRQRASTFFTYRRVGSMMAAFEGLPSSVAGACCRRRGRCTLRTRAETVGVHAAGARPSTTSPAGHVAAGEVGLSDRAHAQKPSQVVLAGRVHAGHFGGFAADQGAA